MEQNYRSTKKILQLADSIIKKNKDQIDKTLWTDNSSGDDITLLEALSEKDEATKVEQNIRHIHLNYGLPYRSFAILYRTNAQSRSLEDALRRGGLPYKIYGGINFYQRKEIKDAVAYLRLVVNPTDNESLKRVINYPTRGIGAKSMERVAEVAHKEGLAYWHVLEKLSQLGFPPAAHQALDKFRFMIGKYAAHLSSLPAAELARELLAEAGLMQELRQENTVEALARWENVQELLNAIAEYEQEFIDDGNGTIVLSRFLQEVSLLTDADNDEGNDNKVTLMTLHASKGLEFPIVFLTGLEENLFPLPQAAADPKQLEEERRLFYVGITRAQEKLYLAFARTRFKYGKWEDSLRSRFLDELDASV
ncbi:MAG TPA: 3'-5' exonuclease, partial [Rhodothermales bacterium]|nr:3'-5' exonuclease [Rhodothermales bacterium]